MALLRKAQRAVAVRVARGYRTIAFKAIRRLAEHSAAHIGALPGVGGAAPCPNGRDDLSLPIVLRKIVGSEEAWTAVACVCEAVMSQKEAAERAGG